MAATRRRTLRLLAGRGYLRLALVGVVLVAWLATSAVTVAGAQGTGNEPDLTLETGPAVTIRPLAGAPATAGLSVGTAPSVVGDAAVDAQATRPRATATVAARGRLGSAQAMYGAAFRTAGASGTVGYLAIGIEGVQWEGELRWDGKVVDYGPTPRDPRGGCSGCLSGEASVRIVATVVDLDTGEVLGVETVLSKARRFSGSASTSMRIHGGTDVRLSGIDVGPSVRVGVYLTLVTSASSRLDPNVTEGAATADFTGTTTGTQPQQPTGPPKGISYAQVRVRVTGTSTTTTTTPTTTTTTTTTPPSTCTNPQRTPTSEAESTLVQYFTAIDTGDYATAFALLAPDVQAEWATTGSASPAETFATFMAGHVECVRLVFIEPAPVSGDPEVSASLGIQWYQVTLEAQYKTPFPEGRGRDGGFPPFYKVQADPHAGPGRPPNQILDIAARSDEITTTSTSTTSTSTSTTTTSTSTTTTTRPLIGSPAVVSMGDSFISGEAGRWEGNSLNPALSRSGTDRAFAWKTETHVKAITERIRSWGGPLLGWFFEDVTSFVDEVVEVPTYDPRVVYDASAANGCHRSNVAEVQAQIPGITEHINLACSGATTSAIDPDGGGRNGELPQTRQLVQAAVGNQVRLIVLSIGGNDLHFADIVEDCLYAYVLSSVEAPDYCNDDHPEVSDLLSLTSADPNNVPNLVRKTIDQIRDAMETPEGEGGAGYAPSQYRIVLQSYPSPIPRGTEFAYPEATPLPATFLLSPIVGTAVTNGRVALGCPFWNADATWARDTLVPALSNALSAVATEKQVAFLDLRDFLQNREICTYRGFSGAGFLANALYGPQSATTSEWARSVYTGEVQGDQQESIHPNAYAQQGLQRCLASAYDYVWNEGRPTVHLKCTNQPGGFENVTTQVLP